MNRLKRKLARVHTVVDLTVSKFSLKAHLQSHRHHHSAAAASYVLHANLRLHHKSNEGILAITGAITFHTRHGVGLSHLFANLGSRLLPVHEGEHINSNHTLIYQIRF